jgi:hypothetical protein
MHVWIKAERANHESDDGSAVENGRLDCRHEEEERKMKMKIKSSTPSSRLDPLAVTGQ